MSIGAALLPLRGRDWRAARQGGWFRRSLDLAIWRPWKIRRADERVCQPRGVGNPPLRRVAGRQSIGALAEWQARRTRRLGVPASPLAACRARASARAGPRHRSSRPAIIADRGARHKHRDEKAPPRRPFARRSPRELARNRVPRPNSSPAQDAARASKRQRRTRAQADRPKYEAVRSVERRTTNSKRATRSSPQRVSLAPAHLAQTSKSIKSMPRDCYRNRANRDESSAEPLRRAKPSRAAPPWRTHSLPDRQPCGILSLCEPPLTPRALFHKR